MQLEGTIRSGAGKGAYFMQLGWVVRQCESKLGFTPFPGTLNVNIRDEDLPQLAPFLETAPVSLVPDDPGFCAARVQPVTVQGIPAGVVLPSDDVRIHEHRVLEIIAPCNLKEALTVADGDSIRFDTRSAGPETALADLQREIYEFAASAGALEGFVFERPGLEAAAVDNWIRNLSAQYRDLPPGTRETFQPALNRTLGRA
ncbi:MAG TPA: DUF120 domain-containing protein, partial [Deferrisomatales bacterium]|nr:DUF120 domain-containing protein [Deferrisomatales bacterium]